MLNEVLLLAASDTARQVPQAEAMGVTPPTSSPLEPVVISVASLGVAVLAVGIILCLVRMLKGPHLADRVVAADMLSIHVLALVVLLAIVFESAMFFDAALVVAVLGFASTVAFSQYIYANRGKSAASSGATDAPPAPSNPAAEASP